MIYKVPFRQESERKFRSIARLQDANLLDQIDIHKQHKFEPLEPILIYFYNN
ncbi:hypothetical protein HanRHA438_Chr17g0790241 [Helianthus annuus]|nr:hypothetical protein HanRHA438_Chr17g0790241 [Helianthus annuus]